MEYFCERQPGTRYGEGFPQERKRGKVSECIYGRLYTIKLASDTRARNIRRCALRPKEDEVLIPPDARFRVEGITSYADQLGLYEIKADWGPIRVIHLTEIDETRDRGIARKREALPVLGPLIAGRDRCWGDYGCR